MNKQETIPNTVKILIAILALISIASLALAIDADRRINNLQNLVVNLADLNLRTNENIYNTMMAISDVAKIDHIEVSKRMALYQDIKESVRKEAQQNTSN